MLHKAPLNLFSIPLSKCIITLHHSLSNCHVSNFPTHPPPSKDFHQFPQFPQPPNFDFASLEITLLNLLPLNPRNLPRISIRSLSLPKLSIPLIRPQSPIPPAETGGKVVDEGLMVEIVVVGAGPEGDEFVEGPREVIAAVGVDCLEESRR